MPDRNRSRLWPYSRTRPPEWAVRAFDEVGQGYVHIAKNVALRINEFNNLVVPAIERILLGSVDHPLAPYAVTADTQRCLFLKLAIQDSVAFRPKDGRTSIGRPRATDDLAERKRLRAIIADRANSLANALLQYDLVSGRLGECDLDCDPLRLLVAMDRRECAKSLGASTYFDEFSEDQLKLFDAILRYRDPTNRFPRHLAALVGAFAELADQESQDSDRNLLSLDERLGIGSRKTAGHFISALLAHVHENGYRFGGCLPDDFLLPAKAMALFESVLLGTDEKSEDSIYMLNARHGGSETPMAVSDAWKLVPPHLADENLLDHLGTMPDDTTPNNSTTKGAANR